MDASAEVAWGDVDGQRCLVIRFSGNLTADSARTALQRVHEALAEQHGAVTMIWDAQHMTGYETEARTLWQVDMDGLKPRIDAIHLVARSAIIRMGAAVVGMFMRYPIRTWQSLDSVRLSGASPPD
ncbi:MAG TPA: STAS/SEC14 domain-containing protein [Nannocystaceae bacterium]|nr:STAS/SEC14 domain-containing protein [Nannocystaceae bacterium]